MNRLISEQLPNDGGYYLKRLVDEANARLKQIGKQGKRATIKAGKNSLSLQFTFSDEQGKKQRNPGLGAIPMSAKGVMEAEKIAQMVTNQLVVNQFTWDWFNQIIGKDDSLQVKQLTCKEMVEQFKKHYLKQRQGDKNPKGSWYSRCRCIEVTLGELDRTLSLLLVRKIVDSTDNHTAVRTTAISGLVEFLKFFNITDYKEVIKDYKANNNPRKKKRNVPNDSRITEVYQTGFEPNHRTNRRYIYRLSQWQFLYSLLAIYGLRIHEAWNIANWDKPVTLKEGDWVTVDVDDETEESKQYNGKDFVVPAILDPRNKEFILCIKHATKTGYRMAMPISPEGHNWIEEFNLLQPFNLPDISNPLEISSGKNQGTKSTSQTCRWFKCRKYGFKPHDLRHAYNHRGHLQSYNPKTLADSLGHSILMNSTGYLRHMSDSVKLEGMKDAISKVQNKHSALELANQRIKELEGYLLTKNNDIELLQTKLKMYEAIEESKNQK